MDKVLAIQMRRGRKRLQLILLPYSVGLETSGLLRLTRVDESVDPAKGWRSINGVGLPLVVQFESIEEQFKVDASMEEVLQSNWVSGEDRVTETAGLVELQTYDITDLRMLRLPSELLTRISEKISDWA